MPDSGRSILGDMEEDIEDVNGIPKNARIRVTYHMKVPKGKPEDAGETLGSCRSGLIDPDQETKLTPGAEQFSYAKRENDLR